MTTYIYPSRLPQTFIYPDIEPVFTQAPDRYESSFRKIAAIEEMIAQRLSDGSFGTGTLLTEVLDGNPLAGMEFNSTGLDKDLFVFKREYDAILQQEGVISFVVPQLSDILSAEIKKAVDENFPNMNNPDTKEKLEAALRSEGEATLQNIEQAKNGQPQGLGYAAVVVPVATQVIGVGSTATQLYMQTGDSEITLIMTMATQAISLAVNIIVGVIVSVGYAIGVAIWEGVAITATLIADAAAAGAAAAVSVSVSLVMTVAFLVALLWMVADYILKAGDHEKRVWNRYRDELKASLAKLKPAMESMVASVREKISEQKAQMTTGMISFRDLFGEMVAKNLQGEYVLGFVSCDCKGGMILTYGSSRDDQEFAEIATKGKAQPMTDTTKGMLMVAAASLFALGRR